MAECHVVCNDGELADGKARCVRVGDKLIAVYRVNGDYFAIDDVCPHMGASLSEGEVDGGVVTCPWHGWRFRLADGTWADNTRLKISSYPVEVVEGQVLIRVAT